jgi:hypothetical protein
MSPEDDAEMTVNQLPPLFAGAAKPLGLGRVFTDISVGSPPDPSLPAMDKEQRRRRTQELLAIAAALLTRPAGSGALSPFDDPGADVRMAAAAFLGRLDANKAVATLEALKADGDPQRAPAGWTLSRWRGKRAASAGGET